MLITGGWGVVVTITAVDEEISTSIAHPFTYGTTLSHSDHQEDYLFYFHKVDKVASGSSQIFSQFMKLLVKTLSHT